MRYIASVVVASICLLVLVVALNSRRDVLQRDDEYRRLQDTVRMANVIAPMSERDDYGGVREFWNAPLTLSNGTKVTVKIEKMPNGNAVAVYSDGSEKSIRPLADYTNHLCVAVNADDLYLLRSITLFNTQYRLLRFDLRNGVIAVDRRVDVGDFCQSR